MLRILGYDYTVDTSKVQRDMDACGRADFCLQVISVANDLSDDQMRSTMLHEIIEVLDYSLDLQLDHGKICQLEAGLYAVLKTNGVDLGPLLDR